MQCLTLQTYDNHALCRYSLKVTPVTHSFFGGQMHTPDLHVRIVIQYPNGSVSKAGVLVFSPTHIENSVISDQVHMRIEAQLKQGFIRFP